MNEEDVKNKIIVPYLKDIGFEDKDFEYERNFTVNFAKGGDLKIDNTQSTKTGRADILVKKNGRNLFILEIKRSDHPILDKDIDQAISYARLLDKVAPFVIVTNGQKIKVVDTLERTELDGAMMIQRGFHDDSFSISIDPSLRFEALKKLLELNPDNLAKFCSFQVATTMNKLQSRESNFLTKFIPELYINRESANSKLQKFLKGDNKILLITGDSGVGKTNFVCNIVNNLINSKKFVFHFYAAHMSNNLPNTMANILNWSFKHDKDIIQYFDQISDIAKENNNPLIIVVDGIDEWAITDAALELDTFIQNIEDSNVKLIFSCKNTQLSKFLTSKNVHTTLYIKLFDNPAGDYASFKINSNIINLGNFDQFEYVEAIQKYAEYYGKTVSSIPFQSTFKLLSNPGLLRIFFQSTSDTEVNLYDIHESKIFQSYINEIIKYDNNKLNINACLAKIGDKFLKQQTGSIVEDDFRNEYGNEIERLYDFGVLIKSVDENNDFFISFSSDYFKNYVIAFKTLKLNLMRNDDLDVFLIENEKNPVIAEASIWMRKDITESRRKEILNKVIFSQYRLLGLKIIEYYQETTKEKYPFLYKDKSKLILMYYNDTLDVHGYSLDETFSPQSKNEVVLVGIDPNSSNDAIFREHDVHTFHETSAIIFNDVSAIGITNEIIQHKIKYAIEHKSLIESNNKVIMKERLIDTLFFIYKLGVTDFNIFESMPISYNQLQVIVDEIKRNLIMTMGIGKNIFPKLDELINSLKNENILNPVLPLGDRIEDFHKSSGRYPGVVYAADFYSKEKMLEYITKFFKYKYTEYRTFVESNFPTLKRKFESYLEYPFIFFGELYESNSTGLTEFDFKYTLIKKKNWPSVYEIKAKSKDEESNFLDRFEVRTKVGVLKSNWEMSSLIYDFFRSHSRSSEMPLTNYLYDMIEKEYLKITK
jgi:hypothetical protein